MTNSQSKLLTSTQCTCKDFHHPWTDKCVNATIGLMLASTSYSLRLYTVVYVLSLIMRRRAPKLEDLKTTVLGIIRSSVFLTTNSCAYPMYNCLLRKIIGRYYCATVAFLPSFLASWTAILVERPTRRSLLTLYVANIATEALWHMAEARGLISSIPHGQTLVFSASISILLYLYRLGLHETNCNDSVFNILRIFLGEAEEGPIRKIKANIKNTNCFTNIIDRMQVFRNFMEALKSKHPTCIHKEICINYAMFSALKLFASGVSLQLTIKILRNITEIVRLRLDWRKVLLDWSTLNLGLFLGSFSFLYKAVSCTLRHSFGYDDARFAIPAGLIGGVAFMQYSNNTVALYVMWKMLQITYKLGIAKGITPRVPGFQLLLYSFCTAILFHASILEPKTLRSSYFKFMGALSGERTTKFNVASFDIFGQQASQSIKEVMERLHVVNKSVLPKFALASD